MVQKLVYLRQGPKSVIPEAPVGRPHLERDLGQRSLYVALSFDLGK